MLLKPKLIMFLLVFILLVQYTHGKRDGSRKRSSSLPHAHRKRTNSNSGHRPSGLSNKMDFYTLLSGESSYEYPIRAGKNGSFPSKIMTNHYVPSIDVSTISRFTNPAALFNLASAVKIKVKAFLNSRPYYYGNRYGSGIYAVYHDPLAESTEPPATTIDVSYLKENWYRKTNESDNYSKDQLLDVSQLNRNWYKINKRTN